MLVMSLLGSLAQLCVPLWFTAQRFSAFRGQHCEAAQEPMAGRVHFLLLPATKHVASRFAAALIDARSVSSFWCVSDTTANKGPRCSPPPQFTAPLLIARVSGLTWDSPRCHSWMFRSLLTGRPGARAVVCILMTDSHISIVLIPANIISAEGFISGRDEKKINKKTQPSFFKSQVISVLSRVKLYRGRFFFFFYQQQKVLCSC